MPQKRLTSADHYIYHSVTQRYNIPSQLDSIFISFTHNGYTDKQKTKCQKSDVLVKKAPAAALSKDPP